MSYLESEQVFEADHTTTVQAVKKGEGACSATKTPKTRLARSVA